MNFIKPVILQLLLVVIFTSCSQPVLEKTKNFALVDPNALEDDPIWRQYILYPTGLMDVTTFQNNEIVHTEKTSYEITNFPKRTELGTWKTERGTYNFYMTDSAWYNMLEGKTDTLFILFDLEWLDAHE